MSNHTSNTGTKAWQAADARHHIHPFTDAAALAARDRAALGLNAPPGGLYFVEARYP